MDIKDWESVDFWGNFEDIFKSLKYVYGLIGNNFRVGN